jgi:hypothetical protein
MEARSIQTPMLTPTAMPIWEVWERRFDASWVVGVAGEVATVEDGTLDVDEVPSAFVDALDDVVGADGEELAKVVGRLLAVLDVLEALEDVVEVVGATEELASAVLVVVTTDGDEAAAELVVPSLSLKVVWYAMTAGALVSWQL